MTTTTQETTDESSTDAVSDSPSAGAGTTRAGERHDADELALDRVFESLKNSRRRQVLRYLQRIDGPADVGELAEHVAAIENDTTVEALSSQQRKRVYVGLYQCHLPKLDDKGVVEYDDDRGVVELGENAPQLMRYLSVADGSETDGDSHPWHRYYAGLAAAALGVLLVGTLVAGAGAAGAVATVTGLGLVVGVAALASRQAQVTA